MLFRSTCLVFVALAWTAGCGGGAETIVTVDPDSGVFSDGGSFDASPIDAGRDMNAVDMATVDMATADMPPVDMTAVDTGAPDMGVPDMHVTGTPGIVVTPTTGLSTSEMGGTAFFTVVLASEPEANVSIGLTSSAATEGTASPSLLTFTSANWNAPQTVTVTGVDDLAVDGDQTYTIATAAAVSTDPGYAGLNADDVTVTNVDNESAGVTVTPTSGLVTTESGGTATFTVVLNAAPSNDVTLTLTSSDTAIATVSPSSLTFTALNWASPQTVTVTGVDNASAGANTFTVVTSAVTSADSRYDGLDVADVTGSNTDDETPGIVVSPLSGLSTTEAGGTAMFTVVLQSEPSADVMLPITSSDTGEGTVPTGHVSFTTANWNIPQAIIVTGVDDALADGAQPYTITVGPSSSSDTSYAGLAAIAVTLTNTDDETAGLVITPESGLVTSEAGGTATFTIALRSEPTASVTIALTSSNTSEGTVSPATLTFTPFSWATPQTVTVMGANDFVADSDQLYNVLVHVSASTDANYSALADGHVDLTNTDDESAGITVTPTTGLSTSEAGATTTFTAVLNSQPTANVVIALSLDVAGEGMLSTSTLTFTSANWNVAQTVTITGIDDSAADGARVYHVVTAAAVSTDPGYSGRDAADVTITNVDNDVASVVISPTSGLTTTEAGGTATFTVVLTSQPTADVVVGFTSSDLTEGSIAPANVTFTSTNWSSALTITVTGIDDAVADGNIAYTIVSAAATSTDASYNGYNASDVSVSNADNEMASIVVAPTSGLTTSEAGGTASFSIMLTSQPTSNVTIALSSNDATEGSVSPASLTFTSLNWNIAQSVTAVGIEDYVDDGNVAYTIVTSNAVSTDPMYSGRTASDVSVTNTDDDTASVVITPVSGLTTTESGGTATFTVVLTSQPTDDVVVYFSSSDLTEGTISPAGIGFSAAGWSTPLTVTVTGIDDASADGDIAYTVLSAAISSSDSSYNGMDPSDVSVTNVDNEAAGVAVTPTSGLATTEAGGTATFSLVLTSQPTANVTISLSSNDTTEGTVSPASLTFTSANWNVTQNVVVSGVDDFLDDGNVAYTIVTGDAVSTDAMYSGRVVSDAAVTNTDNDTASVTVTPTTGLVTTEAGGTATFTVVLGAMPSASVTIGLASSSVAEGTVSPASLTFTTANWNLTQTVTVTGVADAMADGNVAYTIVTGAASSSDAAFNGLAVSDVSVTNRDAAGVTVNVPTSVLFTTQAGGTATFTVVLASAPTANVTIALSSNATAEATVSPASLTFTTANWNMPQTVTATGVSDAVTDGNVGFTIVTGAAVSTDALYNGLAVPDVAGVNLSSYAQQAYIKASNTDAGDSFGNPVVLSGDGTTMAVGTPGEASNATGIGGTQTNNASFSAGAVYVFTRSGATWTQQAYIKASNTGSNDFFGYSVALSTDGSTLAVGATGEDSAATGIGGNQADNSVSNSGAAYVFTRSGATWTQQAYVKASNSGASDLFGAQVALAGDGSTLAVGAYGEGSNATGIGGDQSNNAASGAGAVYVYTRSGVTWTQQAYVKASNTEAGDSFGRRVAISTDGNTMAVGAVNEDSAATTIGGNQADNTASNAGAVYVYTRAGSVWTQQSYLKASNIDSMDTFGSALALSSDGSTLAVGSVGESSNGSSPTNNTLMNAGAVYAFVRSAGVWTQQAYIKSAVPHGYDTFGNVVSLSADGNILAIGAPGESSNTSGIGGDQTNTASANAGATYVFARLGTTWFQYTYAKASNTDTSDSAGWSVSLTADGLTLAFGSPSEDSNATGVAGDQSNNASSNSGAVYVLYGN